MRAVEPMEPHAGAGRVRLPVERRRLDGLLLLLAGQAGEAGGEKR
jgi:hypothetical protein